ncbi:hypothetical protein TNCV_4247121 [Trichonephila clavipes]|nr:hypothetical protein TNCV_4247121 [Trichonephila clavipes]
MPPDQQYRIHAPNCTMQVTVRFGSVPPILTETTLGMVRNLVPPLFTSTNLTRGLAARRLFRVDPMPRRQYTFANIHAFPRVRIQAL